ncbi:MAG: bifunctional tetrahydrofolate synthase/dihydrofolate synthase [Fuerstiella sp.]
MQRPETQVSSYEDAMRWIFDRINYERVRPRAASEHFRLERIAALLDLIDAPQNRIPAIHIAGTKGKGSTAAMVDSILRSAGIRSGLFTSPHIETFEERMRVDGQMPDPDQMIRLVADLRHRLAAAPPDLQEAELTYFEVATLLGWMFFDRSNAEYVVLETGLGGRLDCTNVCQPVLTLITAIGLDHTHILGDTVEQIAFEKAGIIKHGVPVLTSCRDAAANAVIENTAEERSCTFESIGRHFDARPVAANSPPDSAFETFEVAGQQISVSIAGQPDLELQIPLCGRHQADNAALAIRACQVLQEAEQRITAAAISSGLQQVNWPLRFETVATGPQVILDVAHNPDSIAAFCDTLKDKQSPQPRVLIFASSKDKDYRQMLSVVVEAFDHIVCTQYQDNPRAVSVEKLSAVAEQLSLDLPEQERPTVRAVATPATSLDQARQLAGPNGTVCGTGSFFLATELRQIVRNAASSPIGKCSS